MCTEVCRCNSVWGCPHPDFCISPFPCIREHYQVCTMATQEQFICNPTCRMRTMNTMRTASTTGEAITTNMEGIRHMVTRVTRTVTVEGLNATTASSLRYTCSSSEVCYCTSSPSTPYMMVSHVSSLKWPTFSSRS